MQSYAGREGHLAGDIATAWCPDTDSLRPHKLTLRPFESLAWCQHCYHVQVLPGHEQEDWLSYPHHPGRMVPTGE